MSGYRIENVRMVAQSVVVPSKEINIYDEAEYYDNNVKKIDRMRKMVGFYKRRVSDKDVSPAYYAIDAAEKLFAGADVDRNSIDAVVYMAQRQDWSQPSTVFWIHQKLNLPSDCPVITVNQGCPAWVYGMWTASQMVTTGANKRVLLLAADTPSVGIDPKNRISAPVFGDAGCATLLEYDENAAPIYFDMAVYSDGFEAIITPISGAHCVMLQTDPEDRKLYNDLIDNPVQTPAGHKATLFGGYMDGIQVFDFTISKVPISIHELMKNAGTTESDIKFLCLHQANKQIVQAVATQSGFPLDKAPYYAFETYGNNTMCSIPTTLNTVVRGAGLSDNEKIICSAFGNGLAVASMQITLDSQVKLLGVSDWTKPDWFMTRDEYIGYWKNKLATEQH